MMHSFNQVYRYPGILGWTNKSKIEAIFENNFDQTIDCLQIYKQRRIQAPAKQGAQLKQSELHYEIKKEAYFSPFFLFFCF